MEPIGKRRLGFDVYPLLGYALSCFVVVEVLDALLNRHWSFVTLLMVSAGCTAGRVVYEQAIWPKLRWNKAVVASENPLSNNSRKNLQ